MVSINPTSPISELVPYSSHVHTHVIKTVGGDYLVCWNLAGMPFVGRDEWDIEHRHNTFNRLLQTLRAPDYTNVSFWVHDTRRRRRTKLNSTYADTFNQTLNDAYFAQLNEVNLMQNELFLTLIYRPNAVGGALSLSADLESITREQVAQVNKLLEMAASVQSALVEYAPYRMGTYLAPNGVEFSEILEFYGYLLNHVDEPVPVLKARIADYLPTSQHIFNQKAGNHLIRTANGASFFGTTLSIKEYSDGTYPGILNGLKYVNMEYTITHSFSPLSRYEALKNLERTKGRLISTADRGVSQLIELDEAMDGLSSGNFVFGEYHFALTLYAPSLEQLDQNVSEARAVLSNAGFVTTREDVASMAAFYAQLPCNWKYRTRKSNVSSLNFLGLSPLHNFATGKRSNNPWGDAVTVLQTTNSQPFYFNFHATANNENSLGEKALANTMVIGKSGTGKTALINFLLSQVQKVQPRPTIFFFDKDRGAEIFVRACGGRYMALENGAPTGFNPFQCEATEDNTMFLIGLVKLLADKEKYAASEDEDIMRAVKGILDTPSHLRSMTNLQSSFPNLGDDSIYARLRKWTNAGYLGWVFDNPVDKINFENANIIGFDYTDLIDNPEARVPVITYLIKRMEELIDGRPFIYVMDEFWKILDGEGGLKEFARNKLKTIRKQNGLGIFATQSPEDALKSDIAASLIEQTATLILLPNPNADYNDYVEGLKLTKAEFEELKRLDERSRCFLVKQGHHTAVCQLKLGDMPDALAVISASTDNIGIMHRLIDALPDENGNETSSLFKVVSPDAWLPDFYKQRAGLKKISPLKD
jgi:type IV secretion system protein VirB4